MGMPNISAWAKKQRVDMEVTSTSLTKNVADVGGNKQQIAIQKNVATAIEKADGDAELEEVAKDCLKKSHLQQTAIDLLWQQTVVDITSTVSPKKCQLCSYLDIVSYSHSCCYSVSSCATGS
jgi:hypothetical protein